MLDVRLVGMESVTEQWTVKDKNRLLLALMEAGSCVPKAKLPKRQRCVQQKNSTRLLGVGGTDFAKTADLCDPHRHRFVESRHFEERYSGETRAITR